MDKVYGLLSIAAKAGRIVSGSDTVLQEVKSRKAKLVVLSEDASQNTRKLFQDKASYREIPVMVYGNSEDLGRADGRPPRVVLAVLDEGFSKSILKTARESRKQYGENENL
jgi:ribosomal protein L7Ae-like RNA K-turn-binding protein